MIRRFTMLQRVAIFHVLTFAFTIVLAGIQEGAAISPEGVILPQWGSGLAALVMLVFHGDRHRFSVIDRSIPLSRYVVAALVPIGGALAAYLIETLILGAIPFGDTASTPGLLLLWMPLGAFGEELGWRGYLHKRLNIRLAGLPSSLIVGIMWALGHVGLYQNGVLLVQATAFNVMLAAIFHLTINITNLLSYSIINEISFIVINALVWAAIAVAVVLTRRSLFIPEALTT